MREMILVTNIYYLLTAFIFAVVGTYYQRLARRHYFSAIQALKVRSAENGESVSEHIFFIGNILKYKKVFGKDYTYKTLIRCLILGLFFGGAMVGFFFAAFSEI